MAFFDFGKKKEEEKKTLAVVAVRQVRQKKSKMTAALKQRTEFAVLRYWVQAVNPATNSMKTQKRQ